MNLDSMKNIIWIPSKARWIFYCLLIFAGVSEAFSMKVEFQTSLNAPSQLTATAISNSAIQLTWTDNSDDETRFKIERSFNADTGFESFAILPSNSTYLVDHGLLADTTYFYRVSALNETGNSDFSNVVTAITDSDTLALPYYWEDADIGSPRFAGSATFENGIFTTTGSGRMNANTDDFHFVYQSLSGNGEMVAQITKMPRANWARHGVMIRESFERNAQYAMTELYRNQNVVLYKGRAGEEFKEVQDSSQNFDVPIWIKMSREGDQFISSFSEDGVNWTEFNRETITMSENTFIGLVSHANTNDKESTATWRDVAASQSYLGAPSGLSAVSSPSDEVVLTWQDNSEGETGFRIERALKNEEMIWEELVELSANRTQFTDDGLTPGGTYFYRVRSIDGNAASFPSTVEKAEVLLIPNTILFMERKIGDIDRTKNNNSIQVTKTADTVKNVLRHPGMNGKQIVVALSTPVSSLDGAISFKIIPSTHQQTVEFFSSDLIKISQVGSELLIDANNIQNTYQVTLDSVTCNHIVLNFRDGIMTPYVNGEFFDEINTGTFEMSSFSLQEFDGNIWDVLVTGTQMSLESIKDQSDRCVSGVQVAESRFSDRPFSMCRVYGCLWEKKESDLQIDRKRGRLMVQDITFDRNTFDIGM